MSSLRIHTSWQVAAFCVCVLAVWLWLALRRRELRARPLRAALLEALRLLVLALLLFTLCRPEWVRRLRHKQMPAVAVLQDASGSMATRDEQGSVTNVVMRRATAAQLAERARATLADAYAVTVSDFDRVPEVDGAGLSTGGTDINGALLAAMARQKGLRALLLITDGDWNTGETPLRAGLALRGRDVPVFSIGVGSERYLPDLHLQEVRAPAFCLLKERVSIPFAIRSHLPREVHTAVTLRCGQEIAARNKVSIPAQGAYQGAVMWQPQREGDFQLTLSVPVEPEELLADNNTVSFRISVRVEVLKVLVVDGAPRWEYRFLRNALERDPGVEVSCLLFHSDGKSGRGRDYLQQFPAGKSAIARYDVVFLGDVGIGQGRLSTSDARLLRGLVEHQGSGLVFLPGSNGRHTTWARSPLGDLLPVVLDTKRAAGVRSAHAARLKLTKRGERHFLTSLADKPSENGRLWRRLPGFFWHAPVERARAGATVLAVHESDRNQWGRTPLLVTRPFGSGSVCFMGIDNAWRWRRGVEDKYHYRFWGQVVRWMAHQRHLADTEGIRLFFMPENPIAGDTVALHATVFNRLGRPAEGASVEALISGPDSYSERITLSSTRQGWGVHTGRFVPKRGGPYTLEIRAPAEERRLSTELIVAHARRERVGQPARFEVLRELAEVSRGAFGRSADFEQVLGMLRALPTQRVLERRIRLWSEPWWGGLIFGLMCLWWILRKMFGLI